MVFFLDEGGEFPIPRDALWKFLSNNEVHRAAHSSRRNLTVQSEGPSTRTLRMEALLDGSWVPIANRITMFPPLGMVSEMLEGPFAGSRVFSFYVPRGATTEARIVGELASPTLDAPHLEAAYREFLEQAYREDREALEH